MDKEKLNNYTEEHKKDKIKKKVKNLADYKLMPESNQKYVATPIQIAEIMDYCSGMTVHGRKGLSVILPKVLTAIEGINGISYGGEKIKLEKLLQRR